MFQPLIRARLGMLDLEWFKQQVRYCQMPNGIVTDRVRQVGGRYKDWLSFDFMTRMGVWTENFSLPAVLNECCLQSHGGTLRLFPNTKNLGPVRFQHLRARGAFLISAAWDGQSISPIEILSERGAPVRMIDPWSGTNLRITNVRDGQETPYRQSGQSVEFATRAGEEYRVEKA